MYPAPHHPLDGAIAGLDRAGLEKPLLVTHRAAVLLLDHISCTSLYSVSTLLESLGVQILTEIKWGKSEVSPTNRAMLANQPTAPYCRPLAVLGDPERSRFGRQTVTGSVSAPSEAWRFLPGGSPG